MVEGSWAGASTYDVKAKGVARPQSDSQQLGFTDQLPNAGIWAGTVTTDLLSLCLDARSVPLQLCVTAVSLGFFWNHLRSACNVNAKFFDFLLYLILPGWGPMKCTL